MNDNSFIINVARIVDKETPITASRMIHEIFDGIFNDIPEKIECKAGCSFCCNNSVSLTNTELKELANQVRINFGKKRIEKLKKDLKSIENSYQKLTKEERILDRTPCPLLSDKGLCEVYNARPLMCRAGFSYSKSACEIAETDANLEVPMDKGTNEMAKDLHVGIMLGERKKEYEITIVEGLLKEFRF